MEMEVWEVTLSTNDLAKLVELLKEHPEWREQLRAVLLSEELLKLPQIVAELVQAQRAAERRLSGVEERLTRLEAAVEALAEAQKRTELRVEELAEAQRRSEERLTRLEAAVEFLGKQVGSLANIVGTDIEEDASDVLRHVLRQKGWKLMDGPFPLSLDGEVDVAAHVEDPGGQRMWVVVEVKLRMRRKEVYGWYRRLQDPQFVERLRQEGIRGTFLPYAFGIRVYSDALAAAAETGIGVLDTREERVSPAPMHIS